MDGGVRSGQDVLRAVALGARGTMIGRAMVYGLGAMGEAGVTRALQIIHKELPPCQTPGYEQYAWEANLVEYCVDMSAAEIDPVQSPMLAKPPACAGWCAKRGFRR